MVVVMKLVKCDKVKYKISGRPERKIRPVVLHIDDGNIQDYEFRLTPEAARKIGRYLIEAADETTVKQIMET